MADDIKVSPSPIQRNVLDVAVELTQLYYKQSLAPVNDVQDIQETYAKMFAIANALQRREINYLSLLPENLK